MTSDELRAIAEKATLGSWKSTGKTVVIDGGEWVANGEYEDYQNDAAFIGAANPSRPPPRRGVGGNN